MTPPPEMPKSVAMWEAAIKSAEAQQKYPFVGHTHKLNDLTAVYIKMAATRMEILKKIRDALRTEIASEQKEEAATKSVREEFEKIMPEMLNLNEHLTVIARNLEAISGDVTLEAAGTAKTTAGTSIVGLKTLLNALKPEIKRIKDTVSNQRGLAETMVEKVVALEIWLAEFIALSRKMAELEKKIVATRFSLRGKTKEQFEAIVHSERHYQPPAADI